MTMTSYQVETFGMPLAQKLREVPMPQGREVVLRIGSCGVCHSDVHLHDCERWSGTASIRRSGGGFC